MSTDIRYHALEHRLRLLTKTWVPKEMAGAYTVPKEKWPDCPGDGLQSSGEALLRDLDEFFSGVETLSAGSRCPLIPSLEVGRSDRPNSPAYILGSYAAVRKFQVRSKG